MGRPRGRWVLLGLFAVLAVAGALSARTLDREARESASGLVAAQVQRELALPQPPTVVLGGPWFLWQALRGRYDLAIITTPELTNEGTTVEGVQVDLRDVRVPHRVLLGRRGTVTVGSGSARALVPWSVLEARASAATGATVRFTAERDGVRAATTVPVLGRQLDLTLTAVPELAGRGVVLRPQRVSLAGRELAVADVRSTLDSFGVTRFTSLLDGVEVGADQVPPGVDLRRITVAPDGLVVQADLTRAALPVPAR